MKPNTLSSFLFVLLTYLALSPTVQAVNPPPDGGYSHFTTAEGTNALLNLTSGAANTGLGWSSLLNVTTVEQVLALEHQRSTPQILIRLLALQRFC